VARLNGDYYECKFVYDPEFIAIIKQAPKRLRWWDPSERCWTIHRAVFDSIAGQARYMGFSVRVERLDDDNDDGDEPPPPPPRTAPGNSDPTTDFAQLLSYEALHAAYKKMSLEVHPDRPDGGDVECMKRLNNLWDLLQKKFGKK
jgi:hypothetical protein